MGVVGSLGWLIPVQVGAYFGYLTFGFLADRFGRRRTFIAFMISAAALVPMYGQFARSPLTLLALGPLFGYVGHGYFSLFGGFIAELFPAAVRATGQGTCVQHRTDGRGGCAIHDRRAGGNTGRRNRACAGEYVGVLSVGGGTDLYPA